MRRSAALKAVVVLGASVAALACLLLADFVVALVWTPPQAPAIEKPYVAKDHGWYELRPNFTGYDQFGPFIYAVETDAHGFRRKPASATPDSFDVIFLGDSFTYGMNGAWDDTFVGMFANGSSRRVLNAGTASYSPTAYLHQYRKALAAQLMARGHAVVIALDVSDVQDEAGIWTDGDTHPRKVVVTPVQEAPAAAPAPTAVDFRASVIESLPRTWSVYRLIRYDLLGWNRSELIELPRSAFTYRSWAELDGQPAYLQQGYAPLGVAGGLKRIEEKLLAIMELARTTDARVYLLVYPWPAQVAHPDRFSWAAFASDVCTRGSCAGVVDTIAVFRDLAARDRRWQSTYYISGDTHFTSRGNRVVADELLKTFGPQSKLRR